MLGTPRKYIARRGQKGQVAGLFPAPRPVVLCECGDHAFVALSRWGITLVSPEDVTLLASRAWHLHVEDNGLAYACGKHNRRNISLHRTIAKTPPGFDTDHKNTNGLDNRRGNLRRATRAENNRNRRLVKSASGYWGVTLHKASGLWRGFVNSAGKQISAGYFHDPESAAAARDALCIKLGLTTVRLNFTSEARNDAQ